MRCPEADEKRELCDLSGPRTSQGPQIAQKQATGSQMRAQACLWVSFRDPWGIFVSPRGVLGRALGDLGGPKGRLGAPLGSILELFFGYWGDAKSLKNHWFLLLFRDMGVPGESFGTVGDPGMDFCGPRGRQGGP